MRYCSLVFFFCISFRHTSFMRALAYWSIALDLTTYFEGKNNSYSSTPPVIMLLDMWYRRHTWNSEIMHCQVVYCGYTEACNVCKVIISYTLPPGLLYFWKFNAAWRIIHSVFSSISYSKINTKTAQGLSFPPVHFFLTFYTLVTKQQLDPVSCSHMRLSQHHATPDTSVFYINPNQKKKTELNGCSSPPNKQAFFQSRNEESSFFCVFVLLKSVVPS